MATKKIVNYVNGVPYTSYVNVPEGSGAQGQAYNMPSTKQGSGAQGQAYNMPSTKMTWGSGAQGQAYTTVKSKSTGGAAPTSVKKDNSGDTSSDNSSGGSGGGYSYNFPSFDVDLDGIWEQAGQMADAEINPQLAEIDRLLQQAGYSADESSRAINEAYPLARRSLQKSIYENYVAGEGNLAAMGTGRGGGRQELMARAGEREAVGIEGIETSKQRELGAIGRALENYKGQMGNQKVALEGNRGNLRALYAEQIRGNRFNEASTRYNAAIQQAALQEQARQFNESLSAGSGQGTTGVQPSAGLNYFLSDEDIARAIPSVVTPTRPGAPKGAWGYAPTSPRRPY